MAKLNLNSALKGIRGMIDGWVYKKFGDGAVLTRKPTRDGPPTAPELAQRDRFRQASAYAVGALANPTLRAFYELAATEHETPIRPYAIALGDYFTAPVITQIDPTDYHGVIGDTIAVTTTPANPDVAGVTVTLRLPASGAATEPTVLETGAAVLVDGRWVYTATVAAPSGAALTIEAKAVDAHGKERSLTTRWPS
jgi:hypothetical protein